VAGQDRTEREVIELIVSDGPQARAIRAEADVARLEQLTRLAYPNPSFTHSREGAGFTEFDQAEQSLPMRLAQNVRLPQGHHIEYGGQFESEAEASRQLLWLSCGVVVAIFFILSAAFGSSRDGLLIMLNLPLALIGGVIGVYLADGVLSVASIVGFITLFGIATRNGIMLVSHIRHLQEHEGVTSLETAVIRGATERLVPILMTALAAGLALVPIALSAGEPGSEIQAPMAMVIMSGLLSSTALNRSWCRYCTNGSVGQRQGDATNQRLWVDNLFISHANAMSPAFAGGEARPLTSLSNSSQPFPHHRRTRRTRCSEFNG
jgi:hypothetical protein